MVFFRTHFRTHYLRFILAKNYHVFLVDMDYFVQVNLHFSKELQWFCGGHGFFSSSEHICNVNHKNSMFANPSRTRNNSTKAIQIGISCSGTKKCSQKYKINYFCLRIFSAIQPSEKLPEMPPWTHLDILLKYILKYALKYLLNCPLKYVLKYILEYLSNY